MQHCRTTTIAFVFFTGTTRVRVVASDLGGCAFYCTLRVIAGKLCAPWRPEFVDGQHGWNDGVGPFLRIAIFTRDLYASLIAQP